MNQPTFGTELRTLRKQRGLSLKKFAKLVNYDPGYLSKIENDLKPPTTALAKACDTALDTGGQLAQRVDDRATTRRRRPRSNRPSHCTVLESLFSHCPAQQLFENSGSVYTPDSPQQIMRDGSTMSARDVQRDQGEEDTTKRREAIACTGKALAALHPVFFETVERFSSGRVDANLVSAHREISQTLAGLYRSADPRSTLPIMTGYANELLDLLDTPMSDGNRAALTEIAVGAHAQAGLWACHMHKPSLAYRHLATSHEVATATGDPLLHARSLGALSYLFSSRLGEGKVVTLSTA